MSIERRLAKLEQEQIGDGGAGVVGIGRANHDTGTGSDVVTVAATGEAMSTAAFRARYPLGLLVVRTEYGPTSGAEWGGDSQGAG